MDWDTVVAAVMIMHSTGALVASIIIWRRAEADHRSIRDRLGEKAYAEGMARIRRGEIRIGFDLRLWLLDRAYDCQCSGAFLFNRGLALARRIKSIFAPGRNGSVRIRGESGRSIDRP